MKKREIASGKWIRLSELLYKDHEGNDRTWEVAERTTKQGTCDAVAIFALLKSDKGTQTIIISQYRPPIDAHVLEFPAGLIDNHETAEEAAIRELYEETGYTGIVMNSSCLLVSDPGMTNATMKLVTVQVDLNDPKNLNVTPHFDVGENIETHLLNLKDLYSTLLDLTHKGYAVDARLYHLALGLQFQ